MTAATTSTHHAASATAKERAAKNRPSSVGAPAQRSQSSRKGKRAWRKNVDLEEVEEGLEELRAEERLTGTALQKKKDEELFHVDVVGDDQIRKTLPKFSERVLTSTKILAQRSAVPAVFSRATSSSASTSTKPEKRKAVSHDEKGRLLRMGKKLRRGPFDAYVDPDQVGEGSAMLELSEAAKKAGSYDIWDEEVSEGVAVKAPRTQHPRALISLAAVPSPHEGTSYNPPLTSHEDLLRAANDVEEQKLKGVDELEAMKAKMENARRIASAEAAVHIVVGIAPGMTVPEVVDQVEGDGEEEREDGADPLPPKKMPERKTKQQRKKAEKLRAEKRALAEKAARKRMLASVDSVKTLRKSISRDLATRERLRAQREAQMQEKLRQGLAGQKVGKYKVPDGEIAVQLGEELSESLRALKPEGNLFRDRFVSMQHRALIEPHAVVTTKKARRKTKEYEKHSYKKFDRAH